MYLSSRPRPDATDGGVCDRPCARSSGDPQPAPSSTARSMSRHGNTRRITTRTLAVGDHTFDVRTGVRHGALGVDDRNAVTGDRGRTESACDTVNTANSPADAITPAQSRLLAMITWYQRAFAWRTSPCRFFPSCSSYAHEAITVHGSRRGLWLAVRRLSRCRPLGPSGIDLVPPPAGSDH